MTPALRPRLTASAGVAVIAAIIAWVKVRQVGHTSDFAMFWAAAGAVVRGESPYALAPTIGAMQFESGYLNPLPAALAVVPLAWVPVTVAAIVFSAVGMALLAFALTREGWDRLPILMSLPALICLTAGQWSAYVTAAALTPWLAWAAVCKPNIGIATFAARPSLRFVAVASATLAVAFFVRPGWLGEWITNVRTAPALTKVAPVAVPGGILLLLAALKWRRPDARLLLAMALVPQTMLLYDQLALGLLAETRKQALCFGLWSYAAVALAWYVVPRPMPNDDVAVYALLARVVVWGYYLPALLVVLTRPNRAPSISILQRHAVREDDPRIPAQLP